MARMGISWIRNTYCRYLEYHSVRKQNLKLAQEPKTTIKLSSKKLNTGVYFNLREQTHSKHGYGDDWGIENDLKSGIDPEDIMSRKCTKCGIPRNQKGDYYAHN